MSSLETKLRIYDAAETFMQHKQEILRELSKAQKGQTVFAAVNSKGNWVCAGQVTPNTLDFLADNVGDEGHIIALDPEVDKTEIDVEVAIEEWLEAKLDKVAEEEE